MLLQCQVAPLDWNPVTISLGRIRKESIFVVKCEWRTGRSQKRSKLGFIFGVGAGSWSTA